MKKERREEKRRRERRMGPNQDRARPRKAKREFNDNGNEYVTEKEKKREITDRRIQEKKKRKKIATKS